MCSSAGRVELRTAEENFEQIKLVYKKPYYKILVGGREEAFGTYEWSGNDWRGKHKGAKFVAIKCMEESYVLKLERVCRK